MKTAAYALAAAAMFWIPTVVLAEQQTEPGLVPKACQEGGPCNFSQLYQLGTNVTSFIFILVAILSIFSVAVSGFLILISGSDSGKREEAKKILLWALMGLFISLAALAIVKFIQSSLGLTRTGFGVQ